MVFYKVILVDGIDSYLIKNDPVAPLEQTATLEQTPSLEDRIAKATVVHDNYFQAIPSFDFADMMPQPEAIHVERPKDLSINKSAEENFDVLKQEEMKSKVVAIPKPEWDGNSRAKISIIIDDMGMSRKYSRQVLDLPEPLTLAFLPYAQNLEDFTLPAKEKGHELIIHVPMEPMNPDLDLGPSGLTTDLDKEEFLRRLDEDIFPSFDDYVGVNNHMGSKLTQDEQAMNWLMSVLKEKNLLFIDSKTIHTSLAADTAHEYGVDYAERDVFLDHHDDLESVIKALVQLEQVAKKNGHAIAIGHPKRNTIEALRLWMPSIQERGLELVPVSELVQRFEHETEPITKTEISEDSSVTFLNEYKPTSAVIRPSSEDLLQALPPG